MTLYILHASNLGTFHSELTGAHHMTAKGYWIVHISVTDPANYPKYLAADAPVLEKYGAKFLVRGGRYEAAEGKARFRHVVIEFSSYAAALACYHSEEYQNAAKLRQRFAQSELLIVEGQLAA